MAIHKVINMKNFDSYISAISAALVSISSGKAELCKAWKAAIKAALEQDNIEGLRKASEILKEGSPKYWYSLIEQSSAILYRNVKFVGQVSWKKGIAADAVAREAAIKMLDSIVFDLADKPKKEASKPKERPAYNQALAEKLAGVAVWLEKQKSDRDISLITVLKAYADASLNDEGASVLEFVNKGSADAEKDKAARYAAAVEAASAAQADLEASKIEAASLRQQLADVQSRLAAAESKLTEISEVGQQAATIVASREEADKVAAKKLGRANRRQPAAA